MYKPIKFNNMKSCPYCAQTDTRKDQYGYCKKYNCIEVSGVKKRIEFYKNELIDADSLSTYRRNSFNNTHYNPRQEKKDYIIKQMSRELGFVPIDCLKLAGKLVLFI